MMMMMHDSRGNRQWSKPDQKVDNEPVWTVVSRCDGIDGGLVKSDVGKRGICHSFTGLGWAGLIVAWPGHGWVGSELHCLQCNPTNSHYALEH